MESSEIKTYELYYLIAKFLESGPCQRAAIALREEIEEYGLLPKRIDWMGEEHQTSFDYLERNNSHLKCDHLLKICARFADVLNKEVPPSVPGVTSLLGAGSQSLLRSSSRIPHYNPSLSSQARINGAPLLVPPRNCSKYGGNLVNNLLSRTSNGPMPVKNILPTKVYGKQVVHKRQLGHLSSVYCITFDRTGKYIITGADDMLVKIWSTTDGRLLSTLRGHSGEITDLAVNYENTLLAAGSIDKMIRVWNLMTTAPVDILSSHTNMITSVRFCPLSNLDTRYLISTSSDGCVCFWMWHGTTHEFKAKPIKFNERTKPGAQIISLSFSGGGSFLAVGSTDHHVRVYHVSAPNGPEKILEIEAHSDKVDSLQFSNLGLRFISGSRDGTAHIWWYEKQTWKSHVLNMTEQLPGIAPQNESDSKSKAGVNMVCWTCDDAYVVTALSDHSIKIWDANTGKLLHTVRKHDDEVFVVEPHPTDPRIVLSGGHDGNIFLWDVTTATVVAEFHNQIEGQGHGAIFDCKFSPDGQCFAATDSHGHLSIYGFGSSNRYQKVPKEVFFHTDYRPLIRDARNFVIDEQTQCAPHLMPPPFLVDIDGNPYEPHYQRLVPGREHCNDEQLVPYIAIQNERGIAEVLEPVARPHDEFPPPPPPPPPPLAPPAETDHRLTIDEMIERLQQEQDRQRVSYEHGYAAAPSPSGATSRRNTVSGNYSSENSNRPGVRQAGDVEGVRQSSGNWQSRDNSANTPVCRQRMVVKPLIPSMVATHREQIKKYSELEEDFYQKEKKKKPAISQILVKDVLEKERVTRRKRRIIQQRQGVVSANATSTPRPAPSRRRQGIIDYENPEDLASPDESGSNFSENGDSWTESTTPTESDSEEEDDGWDFNADGGDSSKPTTSKSKEAKRAASAKKRKPKKGSSSDSEEQSSKTSSDSDMDASAVLENGIPDVATTSKAVKKSIKSLKSPDDNATRISKYPEWLISVVPKRSPYFPQIGDVVIYCRYGHELYLNAVRENGQYKVHPRTQASKKKNVKDDQTVRIIDMKYVVEQRTTLVCLKLSILNEDGKDASDTFTIRYHDIPDVVDFLVLKETYDNAIRHSWKKGDRFKSIIDDKWWFGTILERVHYPNYPSSWFQCYQVEWDTKETEIMSPWDLEPLRDTSDGTKETINGIPAGCNEACVKYTWKKDEWPQHGMEAECDRIIGGLEKIMETGWAEYFNAPVDLNAYPDYVQEVGYPVDLNTVKTRLENRFYRRLEAVKFDLSFIEHNAKLYNEPGHDIRVKARIVTDLCQRFIADCNCVDPTPLFVETTQNKEMYESTENEEETANGEESKKRSGRIRQARDEANTSEHKPIKRQRSEHVQVTSNSWKQQCKELLDFLFRREDSEPFRHAVDPIQYPDYNNCVDAPMDLSTVREQLMSGVYENPEEFNKDMKLIFSNSRAYNTNKRSRIYSMTIRLSTLYADRIKSILNDYRSAKLREAKLKKLALCARKPMKTKVCAEKKMKKQQKQKVKKPKPPCNSQNTNRPSTSGSAKSSAAPVAPPGSNWQSTYKIPKLKKDNSLVCNGSREKVTNGLINGVVKQNGYTQAKSVQNGAEHVNGFVAVKSEPLSNGHTSSTSKPIEQLDRFKCSPNHSNSETEIESEKQDTDATEIESEAPKSEVTKSADLKRKRKAPVKRVLPKKKLKTNSFAGDRRTFKDMSCSSDYSDSSSGSNYTASTYRSESSSSEYTLANNRYKSPPSSPAVSESDDDFAQRKPRNPKPVSYDESKDSEFEYDTNFCSAEKISSRGRVRKFKGHTKAADAGS